MSATSRASAKWRRKKLDENANEFRAKEALRLRNHRAQAKGKQRHFLRTRLEEDSRVVQDKNELSDGVDAWLYNAVEGHSRTSHSERSSHFSSTHPTPPSQSSSRSIKNPHDDDETLLTPCPLKMVTFQDAHEFLANGQKTLQEWNRRWGSGANFLHRASNAFLGIGLVKVPADRAREEILDMTRKGREALLQLESIAFIDLRSIKVDEFRGFWIETIRVFEGLHERVAQADAVLQLRLDMQTS